MKKGRWIWYPGDFEIYHSKMQNLSREERDIMWPAFWKLDQCRSNVVFTKTVQLACCTEFTVYSEKQGYVQLGGHKYPFGKQITAGPGTVRIEVYCAAIEGLPAVFVEGEQIYSDESWQAEDYESAPVQAGVSCRYTDRLVTPEKWQYLQEEVYPVSITESDDGVLYDFGEEMTASVRCLWYRDVQPVLLCYGESETEARDVENCYYRQEINSAKETIPVRAFRYLFLPGVRKEEPAVTAIRHITDYPVLGSFHCDEEEFDRIWQIAVRTFGLCCGPFIIDGIKRDKWIWSGDAYQSYFTNQYLFFDRELEQRTIRALRGSSPLKRHINTILDYSVYWIISIENHYMAYADLDFIKQIYPLACEMMKFLESRREEHGFLCDPCAWTFVDWADIDKEGAVCAEQMLYAKCCQSMSRLARLTGGSKECYEQQYLELKQKINQFYWREDKGAYIDSFTSGREHVTKHANIFALLFDIAEGEKREQIVKQVLLNEQIDKITTPYFKFFELEALCQNGRQELVKKEMQHYWGGMVRAGVTTFWEEYNPDRPLNEQYGMYNDPYGKSHCHAWGASPIYLLGRYYMGVQPLSPGYERFRVEPQIRLFQTVSAVVPVKDGTVRLQWNPQRLTVCSSREGGILSVCGREFKLRKNEELIVDLT